MIATNATERRRLRAIAVGPFSVTTTRCHSRTYTPGKPGYFDAWYWPYSFYGADYAAILGVTL